MPFSFVFDTLFLPSDLYTTHKWNHDVSISHEFLKQVAPESAPAPSADWHFYDGKLDESIRDDCRDFLQKLPPEERASARQAYIFEDRNGRHTVEIEFLQNGVQWKYILIYDKDSRRIKLIKYQSDVV